MTVKTQIYREKGLTVFRPDPSYVYCLNLLLSTRHLVTRLEVEVGSTGTHGTDH